MELRRGEKCQLQNVSCHITGRIDWVRRLKLSSAKKLKHINELKTHMLYFTQWLDKSFILYISFNISFSVVIHWFIYICVICVVLFNELYMKMVFMIFKIYTQFQTKKIHLKYICFITCAYTTPIFVWSIIVYVNFYKIRLNWNQCCAGFELYFSYIRHWNIWTKWFFF